MQLFSERYEFIFAMFKELRPMKYERVTQEALHASVTVVYFTSALLYCSLYSLAVLFRCMLSPNGGQVTRLSQAPLMGKHSTSLTLTNLPT